MLPLAEFAATCHNWSSCPVTAHDVGRWIRLGGAAHPRFEMRSHQASGLVKHVHHSEQLSRERGIVRCGLPVPLKVFAHPKSFASLTFDERERGSPLTIRHDIKAPPPTSPHLPLSRDVLDCANQTYPVEYVRLAIADHETVATACLRPA